GLVYRVSVLWSGTDSLIHHMVMLKIWIPGDLHRRSRGGFCIVIHKGQFWMKSSVYHIYSPICRRYWMTAGNSDCLSSQDPIIFCCRKIFRKAWPEGSVIYNFYPCLLERSVKWRQMWTKLCYVVAIQQYTSKIFPSINGMPTTFAPM